LNFPNLQVKQGRFLKVGNWQMEPFYLVTT